MGSLSYFMRKYSHRRTRKLGGNAATPTGISAPSYSFLEAAMKNENSTEHGCKCGGFGNCPDCPNKKK